MSRAAKAIPPGQVREGDSVARVWNETQLTLIRQGTARPTVIARDLFTLSAAMYDGWASYDGIAKGVFSNEKARRRGNVEAAREETISYAAYRVLSHRLAGSPSQTEMQALLETTMWELGYPPRNTNTNGHSAAALGNRIGEAVIQQMRHDGANEDNDFADTSGYVASTSTLVVAESGTGLADVFAAINLWQPLLVPGSLEAQTFLTPHWQDVTPFALTRPAPGEPYLDPGMPGRIGGDGDAQVKADVLELIRLSGQLDPSDGERINISPSHVGNNELGQQNGAGHPLNPVTGQPYADNHVLRGDWGRVLAEFWADGPHSSTPPGHWNEIANEVSDGMPVKRILGQGGEVPALEWDVKLYLTLNGALFDASIATWEVKRRYDYTRPLSLIRGLAELDGLPLEDGVIEVITPASAAPGERHAHLEEHIGEVAIYAWRGYPQDPDTQYGGAGWISPLTWLPYQEAGFITPPFPGYTSGHSAFSRAAAEVLTQLTGSPYFPGGLGEFTASMDSDTFRLGFESGPSQEVRLQWATYYDAADEAGISRVYGGIHPAIDDMPGRHIGHDAAQAALDRALTLFEGL